MAELRQISISRSSTSIGGHYLRAARVILILICHPQRVGRTATTLAQEVHVESCIFVRIAAEKVTL